MPSESNPRDETVRLSPARLEFAAALNQRLDGIRGLMSCVEPWTTSPHAVGELRQELLALAETARRLGFAAAAEVVSRLVTDLEHPLPFDEQARTLFEQRLDSIPSLVLRGSYSRIPPANSSSVRPSIGPVGGTLCLFVGVRPTLFERLSTMLVANPGVEMLALAEDVSLEEAISLYTPDVVVFDVWTERGRELFQNRRTSTTSSTPALVVIGALPEQVPEFLASGATRALSHHTPEPQLLRAILGSRELLVEEPRTIDRYGSQNLAGLLGRINDELRRGLLDATSEEAQRLVIDFEEGTEVRAALLAALARIRHTVVERSGGRIEFGPAPDGGVPLGCVPERRRAGGSTPLQKVDLSGRRVILAEDDPKVIEPVQNQLDRAGVLVDVVGDGRRALQHAFALAPDLVISEVLLTQVDGLALCRALKRDIALCDVPVVLISEKEQILAYARELGAQADDYLSKGKPRFDIANHVAHLLGPRIALEQRLISAEEVHGRLDGLSLRSLLHMVARARSRARLSIHDACSRYQVEIRDGALSEVIRRSTLGEATRGEGALASLLGVTRGRFVVEHPHAPLTHDLFQPLAEAVRAPILRSRAAQRVLSSNNLEVIARLVLDSELLVDELTLFPASLRQLMDELIRGVSPRQLLTAGSASGPQLESVLLHVARRGAVRSILDQEGQDLLAREILALLAPSSDPPPATPHITEPGVVAAEHNLTPPTPIALPPLAASAPQDSRQFRGPVSRVLELTSDDSVDFADVVAGALSEISVPIVSPPSPSGPPISPSAILSAGPAATAEAKPAATAEAGPAATAEAGPAATAEAKPAATAEAKPAATAEAKPAATAEAKPAATAEAKPAATAEAKPAATAEAKPAATAEAKPAATAEAKPAATAEATMQPTLNPGTSSREAIPLTPSPNLEDNDDEVVFALIPSTAPPPTQTAASRTSSAVSPPTSSSRTQSPWLLAGGAVVVGFITMSLVAWLRGGAVEGEPTATSAIPTASSTPIAAASLPTSAQTHDSANSPVARALTPVPTPSGVVLPAGKALLEIVTGGAHAIFVDGKFVRRGPSCLVPVNPGTHLIETRLGGIETRSQIAIATGQTGRLELSAVTAR